MVGIFASRHSCPGFESKHSQIFSEEKIVDFAKGYQRHCLEESGQWLENADQTHLVLASGKLVLQKSLSNEIFCSEFRSGQAFHLYQVVGSIFLLLLLQVSSEMALRKKMAMLETDQQDKV